MTDVLIVGWGKGGKTLARALAKAGRSVVVVEESALMYGGTCINIGCVPTKALVHDGETRSPSDTPVAAFSAAVQRRDALTAAMRKKNYDMLDSEPGITLLDGRAVFTGPTHVSVATAEGPVEVSAETIVINTGSRPARSTVPGADGPRIHDSTTIQHVDPLPKHLVVLGDGPIGLEFASLFAHFGSQVTLLSHHTRIAPHDDADVAEALRDVLTVAGVDIVESTEVTRFDDDGERVVVTASSSGTQRTWTADAVLVATGRIPATDGLALDAAGVDTDPGGAIVVDDQLRTSAPHIYAIGDVHTGPKFTYLSLDDYRIVADTLLGDGTRRVSDRVAVPTTTFVTPPLSQVGLTERAARDAGRTVRVTAKKVADIATMPRPKIVGRTEGIIKAVVDAETDEILGATLLCVDSQEVINTVALAMRHHVTATELRDTIFTHPSTTEAFNEVLAG
ncbi:FAD-dependent oxidoreductase [Rhodococcus sp. HNM0569]|uniref:FAD-dependent oxidoreductase n=1 Tax=Rhodococcus sp. HNM0569 TaxID=2716340 RepID=UPI00146BE7DD|nr:FAD-dependent oxidoreductase [Rhodococcus sp. HNM0569]NLU83636.1 FAD-dependent oxidoreductase [Rhodococcus sp. HNM0569]